MTDTDVVSRPTPAGLRLSPVVGAWVRLLVNSAAVAAVMVAAQLGLGDALGILDWDATPSTPAWSALKTWVAFCYAVSVAVGALVGRLPIRRTPSGEGLGARIVAGLAAVVGAAATIGLAWLKTQDLAPSTNVDPALDIPITAAGGVLVGLVLALLALSATPVAAGIATTTAWLWLLAVVSAVSGIVNGEPGTPRLGVPDMPSLLPEAVWSGPRSVIGVAAVIGLVVAGISRARHAGRFGVAFAGFGGPAALAAAYLVAGPGSGADRAVQAEPWLAALLATVAGLVASVLVAFPGRRAAAATGEDGERPVVPAPRAGDDGQPVSGEVVEAPAPRPAWATTSGGYGGGVPYAGAFTGAAGRAAPAAPAAPAPVTHGTSWDGDTWPGRIDGIGGAQSGRARTDPPPAPAPVPDPHQAWLHDLGGTGRHAAPD